MSPQRLFPTLMGHQGSILRRITLTSFGWDGRDEICPVLSMLGSLRTEATKSLSIDNINPNIKVMEYAVRGPLVIRAGDIENELKKGVSKPFKEVVRANIGDCHATGQVPITWIRQVIALTAYPELLQSPEFPKDVKTKATEILKACSGCSVGSYTDSPGIEYIRKHAAEYIDRRDSVPAKWEDIVLTSGATDGIKNLLKMFICDVDGKPPGVMVPIPQYPLYSATLAEFGMKKIDYYLDESKGWGLELAELQKAYDGAKATCYPRVMVVINPGNPTGQVLSRQNIEMIIKFAHQNKMFIFADEVYQDNIYAEGCEFLSLKKVLVEMGDPYKQMELASFMSCSKCYMGECGLRGGYVEVINLCPKVKDMYFKALSAMLCPNTLGQVALDCVVDTPKEGDPSFAQFEKEKNAILCSLKERAKMVADTFNSFEGYSCNEVQGAMYAFPQIKLPQKAIEAAKQANKPPDVFYAFELLENTGICIVPGSGFGQAPGTYHFRTTILPQPEELKGMLEIFNKFHKKFMEKYH